MASLYKQLSIMNIVVKKFTLYKRFLIKTASVQTGHEIALLNLDVVYFKWKNKDSKLKKLSEHLHFCYKRL